MHLYTKHELHRMHILNKLRIERIIPEQDVLLDKEKRKTPFLGRYDFLVETRNNKFIGIEVLSRPTRGKLKEKLAYAKYVDEFIFVLPENSMEFYRKPKTKIFHRHARPSFLGKEFSSPTLYVWLIDLRKGFVEKGRLDRIFNVTSQN